MLTITTKYPGLIAVTFVLFVIYSMATPHFSVINFNGDNNKMQNATQLYNGQVVPQAMGRLIVSFDNEHNKVIADTTGPQEVSIIQLQAMSNIDFKKETSLFLVIKKDTSIVYEKQISEFVPDDARRKVRSVAIKPEARFENFERLEIIIEDRTKKLPFKIDAVLKVK